MTDYTTEASLDALADSVLNARLSHAEWTHAAHFAFALWMLRHRPDASDAESFRAIITRLNEAHGTPNTDSSGYHHTITAASLAAAAAVLSDAGEAPLPEVLAALMTGPLGKFDWIFAHWSPEVLFSVPARRGWVEPDLVPLPW